MNNTLTAVNATIAKAHDETAINTAERTPAVSIPPQAGRLLTKLTQTTDMETALWKMMADYTALKIQVLRQQVTKFETKWGMAFDEFAERCESGTLQQDPYAYNVESDFWEWEQAETLLEHYETLQRS